MNREKVRIYFGTEYMKGSKIEMKTIVAHHRYSSRSDYDIALIQLANSAPIEDNGQYYPINIICLPQNHIFPAQNETTFNGGWGVGHNNRLQIGSRLFLSKLHKIMGDELILFEQRSFKGKGNMVCRVSILIFTLFLKPPINVKIESMIPVVRFGNTLGEELYS